MTANNIARFHLQVLRVIAALYKTAPQTIDVDLKITAGPNADAESESAAIGTITYLHRSGWVTGNVHETLGAILGAQLSASAFAILQRQEPNGPGDSLGQFVVDAVESPNEAAAAEVLMRRLHGN